MKYYSQYGQDKFLVEKYFKDVPFGRYVDIGSHNGIELSNTKVLEDLGWEGICFEPLEQRYNELVKNRTCVCHNYAVSDKNGTLEFLSIDGYSEMLSGIIENYNASHLNRIETEIKDYGGTKKIINVESRRFSDIVPFEKIDYVSIDVEGSEMNVLQSIDFDKHDIKLFSIENNYNNREIIDFLQYNGFYYIKSIGCDDFFEKS